MLLEELPHLSYSGMDLSGGGEANVFESCNEMTIYRSSPPVINIPPIPQLADIIFLVCFPIVGTSFLVLLL